MPPRILFATTVQGTLTGFLSPIADYFRALGWTVDGMASGISSNPKGASHFDRTWEASWSRKPRDRANITAMAEIRSIVAERAYDIVHVHTPVAGFLARLALREARDAGRTKIVYTAHGFHIHPKGGRISNAVFCGLERYAGSSTDVLVVINNEDERLARRAGLVGSGRVCYMPGIGVDLDYYSRDTIVSKEIASIRAELGLGSRCRLFLIVAALDPGKRHRDAVQALRTLGNPDVHLAFAGAGAEDQLRKLVQRLGLSGNVHFLGKRSDIPTLLATAEGLLLPSVREGLPRSILEAMAMGTPVIGTRIRGVDELLGGGVGQLFEVGDVVALAQAMDRLLREPEKTRAMAEKGLQRVKRYALPRILFLHRRLYEGLLGQSGYSSPFCADSPKSVVTPPGP